MCAQYWTFSVLFFVCPLNIQWVLAIAMTIVREGNVLILTAICKRVAANKDDDSLESIVNSLVIFYHQVRIIFVIVFIMIFLVTLVILVIVIILIILVIIFLHQTFLSVCVAILGTDATNYTCVVLDFICNMFLLFKYVFFVFICRRS